MKQSIENYKPIKVLAIAPYQGLLLLLEKESQKYPQIILDTAIGDLEEGVNIVSAYSSNSYDIIISRGGTAKLLKSVVDIPVVEVPLSFYDIFKAIQMSANLGTHRAVVGFESITHNVKIINDLLDLNLDIYTLVDVSDTKTIMQSLASKKYDAVLCDVVSSKIAIEYGLNPILFASGEESVNNAFKEVFQIIEYIQKYQEKISFLKDILDYSLNEVIIFSDNGNLYFSTISQSDNNKLFDFLKSNISNVKNDVSDKLIKVFNNKTYHITSYIKNLLGKKYIVYSINIIKSNELTKLAGIRSYTFEEAKNYYFDNSIYTVWINLLKSQLDKLTTVSNPILITGLYGTGKINAGLYLYLNSPKKKHPLFIIDCSILNEKSKEYLLSNHHSPLFYDDNTIMFVNLDRSNNKFFKDLISELKHLNICNSNKVILTFNPSSNISNVEYLKQELYAFQLNMPSLKDYPDKIPSVINTYLSQINAKHAIEILRLSKNAMNLASNYSWDGNFIQLQQVISQSALNSTDHIIHSFNLQSLLTQEDYEQNYVTRQENNINLHKSLYEIEQDIIELVLKENNGNQSAAAKQLGIGRTTLWRLYTSKRGTSS